MTNATETGPTPGDETPVESAAPKLLYWHVWTDDVGATHQTRCELSAFQMQSMGGRAAPQWNDHLVTADATVLIASLPVGWIGEWHGNPKPQWIVPLSGCWFVETTDGTRVEMGRRRDLLRRRPEREARQRRTEGAPLGHRRRRTGRSDGRPAQRREVGRRPPRRLRVSRLGALPSI